MAQTSVSQFAGELKVQPSVLLEQLKAAGVHKQLAEDTLSEHDKTKLLEYLRKVHGASEAKSKITLMRKQTSEIKKSDSTGKSRTIQVEVKKKRVFVKRDAAAEALRSGDGLFAGVGDVHHAQHPPAGPVRFVAAGRELYAWHPNGVARSRLWAQLSGRRLGVTATARNWSTVTTLLAMAEE